MSHTCSMQIKLGKHRCQWNTKESTEYFWNQYHVTHSQWEPQWSCWKKTSSYGNLAIIKWYEQNWCMLHLSRQSAWSLQISAEYTSHYYRATTICQNTLLTNWIPGLRQSPPHRNLNVHPKAETWLIWSSNTISVFGSDIFWLRWDAVTNAIVSIIVTLKVNENTVYSIQSIDWWVEQWLHWIEIWCDAIFLLIKWLASLIVYGDLILASLCDAHSFLVLLMSVQY